MKAVEVEKLARAFGHLVTVDHILVEWVPTSFQRWKLTNRKHNTDLEGWWRRVLEMMKVSKIQPAYKSKSVIPG